MRPLDWDSLKLVMAMAVFGLLVVAVAAAALWLLR
jgi:hypothetical protein